MLVLAVEEENEVYIGLLIVLIVGVISIYFMLQRTEKCDVSKGLIKEEAGSVDKNDNNKVLNPVEFRNFYILQIFDLNYNTKLIRFEIPFGKSLDIPIGRHISLRAEINSSKVMRAYTPCSRPNQRGYFDLLVKAYEFGKMSSYLHSLKAGSAVEVRGPIGRFKYEMNAHKQIGLIAGGTGLTPCLQVIRCILDGPLDDVTNFMFFFQNRSEVDILYRNELEKIVAQHPDRIQIFYFLTNPKSVSFGQQQKYEVRGYIDQSMIDSYMRPDQCSLVCLCGPSGFNDTVVKLLDFAGHDEKTKYIW